MRKLAETDITCWCSGCASACPFHKYVPKQPLSKVRFHLQLLTWTWRNMWTGDVWCDERTCCFDDNTQAHMTDQHRQRQRHDRSNTDICHDTTCHHKHTTHRLTTIWSVASAAGGQRSTSLQGRASKTSTTNICRC